MPGTRPPGPGCTAGPVRAVRTGPARRGPRRALTGGAWAGLGHAPAPGRWPGPSVGGSRRPGLRGSQAPVTRGSQQWCLARASRVARHSRWHNPTDFAGVPLGLVDPWACHCVTKTCKDWLRTGAGLVWAVWPRAGGPQSPGLASPASRISDQVTGAQGSWKERRHWGAWTPVTRERVLPAARGGREGVRSRRAGSSGGPPGELRWPPGPLLTRSPRQR